MLNQAYLRTNGFLEYTLALALVVLGILFIGLVYGVEVVMLYRTIIHYLTIV